MDGSGDEPSGVVGDAQDLARNRLLAYAGRRFPVPGDPQAVGARYLGMFPQEAGIGHLARLIAAGRPVPDASAIEPWFRAGIARELRASEMVALDGWLFARSEARLCALLALRSPVA
jgi:hypothetical protein